MAKTYAQFKTFIQASLWRANDTALSNNLDTIIQMADNELNKKLDIQRREVSLTIAPEAEDYTLPSDFYQMISLTNLQPTRQLRQGVQMSSTTKGAIDAMRAETESSYIYPYYYTQRRSDASTLYLVGPFSAAEPGSLELNYRTAVPDYETDDASWLEDEYLDLYLYAVLKHAAIFVREDERIQLYGGLMQDALASALDEDKRLVRFGGSPLHMQPNRTVPRTRRKV